MYKTSLAEVQGDDDAFIVEMLSDLPTHFPDVPAAYELPLVSRPLSERIAELQVARRQELHSQFAARRAANDDVPLAAPAPRLLSKKSKIRASRPRRSQARDRRNVVILKDFVPDVRPARRDRKNGPSVGDPLPTSSPPPTAPQPPSKSTIKRQAANRSDTRKAPAWRYTTDIARGHAYIHSITTRGAGLSWSLNLGGNVLKAANDDAPRFMRAFQDRLAKALLSEFGESRDFMFAIETIAGRPHLHGAVDAVVDERERVEAVLVRCGGGWDAKRCAERQAHTDILWGPDGWLRYCQKNMSLTKRQLGLKSVLSVTRGCRARAEKLWEASRSTARSINLD